MCTRERARILGITEERTQNVRYERYSLRNSCLKEGNREHLLKNDLFGSKATFYPSVVCFLKRFSQVPYVLGIRHPCSVNHRKRRRLCLQQQLNRSHSSLKQR